MLYVVGTPIGNLEDLSLRQARIITEAEIILTEDTRSTGLLLMRIKEVFGLAPSDSQKLISYYKEKEFEKLPEIVELIQDGVNIALISQAGMPLISDPGYLLIKTIISEKLPFTVIPGPTAATTALVYSGFKPDHHMFVGFLPKRENEKKKLLLKMKQIKEILPGTVFIAYESPKRIQETLLLISTELPETIISIGRELTKKFEEIVRGKAVELAKREYRGEITIVVA